MAELSKEEVLKIAKLANLELSEGDVEKFQEQLSKILNFVEKNSKVDVQEVRPLFNVTARENIFREDEVKPSLSQKEALANASASYNGYFKVKAVFED